MSSESLSVEDSGDGLAWSCSTIGESELSMVADGEVPVGEE
jgi:hypothetical protein